MEAAVQPRKNAFHLTSAGSKRCVFHPSSDTQTFGSKFAAFLGHSVVGDCINEQNLTKIRQAKRPSTKKEVRSFSGLANYYCDHIPSFAAITALLSDLTRKGLPERRSACEGITGISFCVLRENMLRRPVLRFPDHAKSFVLRTDASSCGLHAAVMQEHNRKCRRDTLTSAERRCSTLENDCLAIVWGMSKFRMYLAGKPFILQTDHQRLTFLNDAEFKNDRIMRWLLAFQVYDYRICLKKGPGPYFFGNGSQPGA